MNAIIVAKAANDIGDDWHWVVLEGAVRTTSGTVLAENVRTVCGRHLEVNAEVHLMDAGAPAMPTCPPCIDSGLRPTAVAEATPVEAVR